jgi:hypothetical protein
MPCSFCFWSSCPIVWDTEEPNIADWIYFLSSFANYLIWFGFYFKIITNERSYTWIWYCTLKILTNICQKSDNCHPFKDIQTVPSFNLFLFNLSLWWINTTHICLKWQIRFPFVILESQFPLLQIVLNVSNLITLKYLM